LEEIRGAISELGYTPRRRNVFYRLLEEVPIGTARVAANEVARMLPTLI
jgi:hypothetical protein